MERADKSAMTERKFKEFISKLSENEILDLHAMSCIVRGYGRSMMCVSER